MVCHPRGAQRTARAQPIKALDTGIRSVGISTRGNGGTIAQSVLTLPAAALKAQSRLPVEGRAYRHKLLLRRPAAWAACRAWLSCLQRPREALCSRAAAPAKGFRC